MTVNISTRAAATTPSSASEVTLFLDSANNNALTAKYYDNTFKTLSGEPVQFTVSEPLTDALNDKLDHLTCAAAKGIISLTDLQTYMNSINLYYTSNIDANGNLTQSITTSSTAASTDDDFTVSLIIASAAISGGKYGSSFTGGVPGTANFFIAVDRNGVEGDIAISSTFEAGLNGFTLPIESVTYDSLGAVTTHANEIVEGTSFANGVITYDGTATTPGTYDLVISLTSGTVTKYVAIAITVS